MIKKAKDVDVYTPEEIKKIRERIEEVNGIPIKEIAVTKLVSTAENLQKEIERLQSFIENLQVVHFTELQREKATVERYEKAFKDIRNISTLDEYEGTNPKSLLLVCYDIAKEATS